MGVAVRRTGSVGDIPVATDMLYSADLYATDAVRLRSKEHLKIALDDNVHPKPDLKLV